jgi:uncharacterized protein YbaR (Trm112 family)
LGTVSGAEEASLVVTYLRANGVEALTWQEGAGRAFGLTVGSLGVSHIMVREDQVQQALSLLEAEVEGDFEDDQLVGDTLSDASKVIMGATAAILSPIGAGLVFGMSQFIDRDDDDEAANLVECPECSVALELSDEEIARGYYICPECQQVVQLRDYVVCPVCHTSLELDHAERQQGWYRCPECDEVTHSEPKPTRSGG